MLQTRNGKAYRAAALKIAVDLVDEGVLSKEAVLKVISSWTACTPILTLPPEGL